MKVETLLNNLNQGIKSGTIKPTDIVKFRTNIIPYECRQPGFQVCEVDYILTAQLPNTLLLCWDDGMF